MKRSCENCKWNKNTTSQYRNFIWICYNCIKSPYKTTGHKDCWEEVGK